MNNCPNCGATVDNHKCNYCGAVFVDFMDITPEQPDQLMYIRIKNSLFKCRCNSLDIRTDSFSVRNPMLTYGDTICILERQPQMRINAEFITIE